jgi:hypothetical protein
VYKQGKAAWSAVDKVIILEKQERIHIHTNMTPEEIDLNEKYKVFLHNLREGKVTQEGVDLLRRRTLSATDPQFDVDSIDWLNGYYIVKRNELRMHINNLVVFAKAKEQNEPLHVFFADNKVRKYNTGTNTYVETAATIPFQTFMAKLTTQDMENTASVVPLFNDMRVTMTKNVKGYTELGYANGAFSTVKSICIDPSAEVYQEKIDGVDCYIYSKPSLYITAETSNRTCNHDPLDPKEVPVKSRETPIWPVNTVFGLQEKVRKGGKKNKNAAVHKKIARMQLPIEPAYALSDYKSQGKSLSPVIANICKPLTGTSSCMSNYVI